MHRKCKLKRRILKFSGLQNRGRIDSPNLKIHGHQSFGKVRAGSGLQAGFGNKVLRKYPPNLQLWSSWQWCFGNVACLLPLLAFDSIPFQSAEHITAAADNPPPSHPQVHQHLGGPSKNRDGHRVASHGRALSPSDDKVQLTNNARHWSIFS